MDPIRQKFNALSIRQYKQPPTYDSNTASIIPASTSRDNYETINNALSPAELKNLQFMQNLEAWLNDKYINDTEKKQRHKIKDHILDARHFGGSLFLIDYPNITALPEGLYINGILAVDISNECLFKRYTDTGIAKGGIHGFSTDGLVKITYQHEKTKIKQNAESGLKPGDPQFTSNLEAWLRDETIGGIEQRQRYQIKSRILDAQRFGGDLDLFDYPNITALPVGLQINGVLYLHSSNECLFKRYIGTGIAKDGICRLFERDQKWQDLQ